jgi:hypothetical protein
MYKLIIPFVIAGLIATPALAEQYDVVGAAIVDVTTKSQWPSNNPKDNVGPVRHTVKVPVIIVAPTESTAPKSLTREAPKSLHGYGGRGGYGRGGWGRGPRYNAGDAIVGGIIGGAVSNWFFRPQPEVVVVQAPPPPPPPPEPEPEQEPLPPPPSNAVVLEPFTPDWFDYCGNKYQSFDPKTGFYVSVEGGKRFCR